MYERQAFGVTSLKQKYQIKNNQGEIIETQKKKKNRNLSLDNKHVIEYDFLCAYRRIYQWVWNIRAVDVVWLFMYSKT